MNNLQINIENYLEYCRTQKRLDSKTIKAYCIDLHQFSEQIWITEASELTVPLLETYIAKLHQQYAPKTVKRKIASLKALFHHLEYKEIILHNPFAKLQLRFREPIILPKTIPLTTIEVLINTIYKQYYNASSNYRKKASLRDIAVIELLFATGIRISELCTIPYQNIDLQNNVIIINGKGSKERILQIGNEDVKEILSEYYTVFKTDITKTGWFFINRLHKRYSEESVRNMMVKYLKLANIDMHTTPHMFRHPYVTPTTKNIILKSRNPKLPTWIW